MMGLGDLTLLWSTFVSVSNAIETRDSLRHTVILDVS